MMRTDDLDRTLRTWFEADAAGPEPVTVLVTCLDATRTRTPRAAWVVRLRGGGIGAHSTRPTGRPGPVATHTQHIAGRSRTELSATRLIALVAMVALGTGALLFAAGQSPSPISTASASPRPKLVTEPVEPGVVRVLGDGIRDLAPGGEEDDRELAIGPDGSVWVSVSAAMFRLGDPTVYSLDALGVDAESGRPGLKVGPDGVPWFQGRLLGRLDDGTWSVMPPTRYGYYDIAPDGTVWSAWPRGYVASSSTAGVSQLGPVGWTDHPVDLDLERVIGESITSDEEIGVEAIRVDGEGDVWVSLSIATYTDPGHLLLRYDGQAWSVADPVGVGSYNDVELLDIGADGTLWAYLVTRAGNTFSQYLARLADERWTVYSTADGVLPVWIRGEIPGRLRVGPDGSVWMTQVPDGERGAYECRGVRTFDGTTWSRYLDGRCVWDLDIAPDGSVWVIEGLLRNKMRVHQRRAGDTYRIDPSMRSVAP